MIKKLWLVGMMAAVITAAGVQAGEVQDKKAEKAKVEDKELVLQEMTVIGTVTKKENKRKDGTPMMTWFRLVDESGAEVGLPKGKIEEFAGVKVKVTGQGYTLEKKSKSLRSFKTITSIEKLEGATPAANAGK